MKSKLLGRFRTYNLEPMIVLYIFALFIVRGSGVNTTLLVWKVCRVELNLTESICDNLDEDENDSYEEKVQRRVNFIQLITAWVGSAPAIFYSLFAGALSDNSGRKPLLILPVFGQVRI